MFRGELWLTARAEKSRGQARDTSGRQPSSHPQQHTCMQEKASWRSVSRLLLPHRQAEERVSTPPTPCDATGTADGCCVQVHKPQTSRAKKCQQTLSPTDPQDNRSSPGCGSTPWAAKHTLHHTLLDSDNTPTTRGTTPHASDPLSLQVLRHPRRMAQQGQSVHMPCCGPANRRETTRASTPHHRQDPGDTAVEFPTSPHHCNPQRNGRLLPNPPACRS
jgi:hypothetical protein